jgi:hypothetical protein
MLVVYPQFLANPKGIQQSLGQPSGYHRSIGFFDTQPCFKPKWYKPGNISGDCNGGSSDALVEANGFFSGKQFRLEFGRCARQDSLKISKQD